MLADWEREVRYQRAIRSDALTPAAEAALWRRRAIVSLVLNGLLLALLALLVRR